MQCQQHGLTYLVQLKGLVLHACIVEQALHLRVQWWLDAVCSLAVHAVQPDEAHL